MSEQSIQIRFDSPEALREEFEKNIANRGIFVETEEDLEVRESVEVEIILTYVDPGQVALCLIGEVVHRIPLEMAASGATPGVAIQFEDSAKELQDAFSTLLGQASVSSVDRDTSGKKRRGSKREAVRVPIRVMPTMSPPFEATSRDLSATGVLLSLKEQPLPLGEFVRICLWHPSGEPSVEIDGKVIREVPNKRGEIAAVAVAFEPDQASDSHIAEVIDALRQAGHRSKLGGIRGSIADLGLANMLQMFGSTAPQGTLVVERDGEQGWIAFAGGQLLAAEIGSRSGHDALVSMLEWGDGRFQFEAAAEPKLLEKAQRSPLEGAVLKAMCELDERARDEPDEESETVGTLVRDATTFGVDARQEERLRSSLDKTGEAVLELARSGMPAEKLKSIIPEPAERVQSALEELVELGVLVPR